MDGWREITFGHQQNKTKMDFTFEDSGPGCSTIKPDVENILSTDVVGHLPGLTLTEIHTRVHRLTSGVNTSGSKGSICWHNRRERTAFRLFSHTVVYSWAFISRLNWTVQRNWESLSPDTYGWFRRGWINSIIFISNFESLIPDSLDLGLLRFSWNVLFKNICTLFLVDTFSEGWQPFKFMNAGLSHYIAQTSFFSTSSTLSKKFSDHTTHIWCFAKSSFVLNYALLGAVSSYDDEWACRSPTPE